MPELLRRINIVGINPFLFPWFMLSHTAYAHSSNDVDHSHIDAVFRTLIDAGSAFFVAIPLAALSAMTLAQRVGPNPAYAITALASGVGLWAYLTYLRDHEIAVWGAIMFCLAAWPVLILRTLKQERPRSRNGRAA